MKRILTNIIIMLLVIVLITGCSSNNPGQESVEDSVLADSSEDNIVSNDEDTRLDGHSLLIFCGAGLKNPFEKIAQGFEEDTGCEMHVTYGNAAQSHTQINKTGEGDFFIAGSKEEVKPVEDFVLSSKDLVQHIPVLAVASGNPKGISGSEDLKMEGVRFIMGDPESTPIGKIASKMIADFKLKDKINIIANTATAPAIATALESDEADVGLVWQENVQSDKLEIVDAREMDSYIKVVPAAMLSGTNDEKAQKIFNDYLDRQEVKDIWTKFGYKIVE